MIASLKKKLLHVRGKGFRFSLSTLIFLYKEHVITIQCVENLKELKGFLRYVRPGMERRTDC